jgi:DNA-binding transcriptional LysR family regulator
MELRHLNYFIAVAEELHFGRASERLHIAQPPLSRQIMQLEQEIKVRLFERTKRHVRLTIAGEAFLEKARLVVAMADDAIASAQRVEAGHAGSLSVAFVGSAMFSLMPEIFREVRSQLPDVQLLLHEMSTGRQVTALQDGSTQVAFVRPAVVHPAIISEVIAREDLMIALPDSHRLADVDEVNLADLSDEPFIIFSRDVQPSFGHQIYSICVAAGFTPLVIQEALEMQTALGLVAGSLGVTLVPESVKRVAWPGVLFKHMPAPAPQSTLSVAYRKGDLSPILPKFLQIARAVAMRSHKAQISSAKIIG